MREFQENGEYPWIVLTKGTIKYLQPKHELNGRYLEEEIIGKKKQPDIDIDQLIQRLKLKTEEPWL